MAAEWNMSFHHEESFGSALNWQTIPSQWGAINSTPEMIPMGNYFGLGDPTGMMLQGNPCLVNNSPGMFQSTSSPDPLPDTGLAAVWTVEEQYKLEEGLAKYANEPGLMKYIKISAVLHEKTVRDVALRCKWMMIIILQDTLMESSSRMNLASAAALNIATHTPMMHPMDQTPMMHPMDQTPMMHPMDQTPMMHPMDQTPMMLPMDQTSLMHHMDQNPMMHHIEQTASVPYGVPEISSMTRHLLEQNAQAFDKITANFCVYKLQDNIDLFCHTRNNIIVILNDMGNTPGIMGQMPPLPVSIDDNLASSILPNMTQSMMFASSSGIHYKQEPWC